MLSAARPSVLFLAQRRTLCHGTRLGKTTNHVLVLPYLPKRTFSTSSSSSSSTTTLSSRVVAFFRHGRWRTLARVIKYVRIPFLVVSVYGLGYQQGIVDYAREPTAKQEALFDSIIAGVGCVSRDHVDVISKKTSSSFLTKPHKDHDMTRRVARVGSRIVTVAQLRVKEELNKAVDNVRQQLPSDCTEEQVQEACRRDAQVMYWEKAVVRLQGQTTTTSGDADWSYVVIDTPVANAFVTEILPLHIFMTTSMMKAFIETDDELALVLGHEVSHLILGHVSEANMVQTFLRTVEVLLLSIDPTEGLMSMAIVGFLATARTALSAAHSRENELLADEWGIQLAAMACFDTKSAAHVFYKMHKHASTQAQEQVNKAPSLLSFLDTHPPSVERHELLVEASDTENMEKYQDTTCASVGKRLRGLLGGN